MDGVLVLDEESASLEPLLLVLVLLLNFIARFVSGEYLRGNAEPPDVFSGRQVEPIPLVLAIPEV